MKNLDIKRLWLTAKWDVTANWKSSAKIAAGMSLGLTLMYTLHLLNMLNVTPSHDYILNQYRSMMMETNMSFVIFMIVGASLIFVNMKTRQQRIAFCMLPASNAEKYLVRWLWATVGFALMFVCAAVAADVLRMVIWWMAGYGYTGSVVATVVESASEFINNLNVELGDTYTDDPAHPEHGQVAYAILTYVISLGVLAHSFYIFGGALFRRNAWLLTTVTSIVVLIVMTYTGNFPFVGLDVLGDELYSSRQKITAAYVTAGIFAVLSIVLYAISWRLFRRMQVINNKAINV